jgi:hypothetical protein
VLILLPLSPRQQTTVQTESRKCEFAPRPEAPSPMAGHASRVEATSFANIRVIGICIDGQLLHGVANVLGKGDLERQCRIDLLTAHEINSAGHHDRNDGHGRFF